MHLLGALNLGIAIRDRPREGIRQMVMQFRTQITSIQYLARLPEALSFSRGLGR